MMFFFSLTADVRRVATCKVSLVMRQVNRCQALCRLDSAALHGNGTYGHQLKSPGIYLIPEPRPQDPPRRFPVSGRLLPTSVSSPIPIHSAHIRCVAVTPWEIDERATTKKV